MHDDHPAISRQGGLCHWCDMPMDRALGEGWAPTREHLVPRHKGGRGIANIAAAHAACNRHRGHQVKPPSYSYLRHQRVNYLRNFAGIYCEKPYSRNRHEDLPNFGRDPDGEWLWAPQYGIVSGAHRLSKPGFQDLT